MEKITKAEKTKLIGKMSNKKLLFQFSNIAGKYFQDRYTDETIELFEEEILKRMKA